MGDFIKSATVLYVEDEDKVREGYSKPLNRCAKELFTASNGEEGLELFKQHNPDIIVTDIKMPKMNGIDMIKAIKDINPDIKVIFTSAHSESEYLLNAIELQAESYFLKPVPSKLLKNKVLSISRSLLLERINTTQQARIQEQEQLLQNIIDTDENISIVSDCSRISFANKAFLNFFDIKNIDQFYNKHSTFFEVFITNSEFLGDELITNKLSIDDIHLGLSFFDLVQSTKNSERICAIIDKFTEEKYFLINISIMDESKGLFLLTLTDITEMTIQKANVQKKVDIDKLTGAYNRNKFEEFFDDEMSRTMQHGTALSMAILDIDHFKSFNDKYGHLIGDEVLRLLVAEVNKYTRKSDLFARWGGEEFVIIFPGTTIEDAIKVSNNVREKISQIKLEQLPDQSITVSFGVTEYNKGDNKTSIFTRCDDALYQAKESGRNCVKFL